MKNVISHVGGVKRNKDLTFCKLAVLDFLPCLRIVRNFAIRKKVAQLTHTGSISSLHCGVLLRNYFGDTSAFRFASAYRKSAFTLAEVLITLVVIGVVAAITVPVMMVNHQKEQTVVQLKKVYSDFCGAVSRAEALNMSRQHWDYSLSGHDFFYEYLTPFISISKKKKSDVENENDIIYLQTSGQPETGLLAARGSAYIVTLMSGAQIFAATEGSSAYTLNSPYKSYLVDVNGQKKPNKLGRDLFMIDVSRDLGVVPHAKNDGEEITEAKKRTRDQLRNGPSNEGYQCSKSGRGIWCAALIMADGWQIKDDYPW